MKFKKLIIGIILFILLAHGMFILPVYSQEDAQVLEEEVQEGEETGEEASSDKVRAIRSTKEFEGEEGDFIDYDSGVGVFWVIYFDKEDSLRFDVVTFFYDDKTTIEYEADEGKAEFQKNIRVEDLKPDEKVRVYVRGKEDKTQHFNIVRTSDHIADRIVIVEKHKKGE